MVGGVEAVLAAEPLDHLHARALDGGGPAAVVPVAAAAAERRRGDERGDARSAVMRFTPRPRLPGAGSRALLTLAAPAAG